MEFTALITILDLDIQSDYWFLLQDTCFIGPNFYKNIMSYDYQDYPPTVSLCSGIKGGDLSMNIGVYSWYYLKGIQGDLRMFYNKDYSIESIQRLKTIAVENEDRYFINNPKNYYTSIWRTISGPTDVYKNGILRITEYFYELDFYKTKANWNRKDSYELGI